MRHLGAATIGLTLAGLAVPAAAAPPGDASPASPQGAPAATVASELPRPLLEGADPQVREQVDAARAILDRLVATGAPDDAVVDALARVCRTYLAYELLVAAEPCLDELARREPGRAEWPYLLGYLHERAGRPDRALAPLGRSAELTPYAPASRRIGDLELAAGRPDRAREAYRAALAADPSCVSARHGLAAVARREGDLEGAVALLRRALEELPGSTQVRYALAQDLRRLGRHEEARAHLAEVDLETTRLRPWWGCPDPRVGRLSALTGGSTAHLMRGLEASLRGDFEAEREAYRQAVVAGPDDPVAHKSLATALFRAGELEAAEAELREAIRLAPDDPSYRFDLGQVLLGLGRRDEAAGRFREAVAIDPAFVLAHRRLVEHELAASRPEAAVEHLRRVAALDPTDAASRARLVMTLVQLGRGEEAQEALARLLDEQPPTDLPSRLRLAALLGNLGDPGGAERHFLAVLALEPEAPTAARAHALLGQLRLLQGRRAEAAERFRAALALDPALAEAREGLRLAGEER